MNYKLWVIHLYSAFQQPKKKLPSFHWSLQDMVVIIAYF